MDANRTLLDDVARHDISVPSTSTSTDASTPARNLLIGELPDGDSNNLTGVAVHTITNTSHHKIFEQMFNSIESLLDESSWLIYTIAGVATLLVIVIICSIVIWILKHKKRVIQQDNDPILTSTYNEGFSLRKCCSCCRSPSEKESQLAVRQNSASNLDPYRRPPLPPIGVRPDSYIGTFNRPDALNGLDRPSTVDEKSLAVNIQSIRGVPHVDLRPDQYRNLPPLKTRYD